MDGEYQSHTAAKFWSCLLEEMETALPGADRVAFMWSGALSWVPAMLRPEVHVPPEILAGEDFSTALQGILAEREILGDPPPVEYEIYEGGNMRQNGILSLGSLDAESMPFMAVWLPAWSHIPPTSWNNQRLHGRFSAFDLDRERVFHLRWISRRHEILEGLMKQSIDVRFRGEPMFPDL